MICVLTAACFFSGGLSRGMRALQNNISTGIVICIVLILMVAAAAGITSKFYLTQGKSSPLGMYVLTGLFLLYSTGIFASQLWMFARMGKDWADMQFYSALIRFFCNIGFAVLMGIQANIYSARKRLAMSEQGSSSESSEQEKERRRRK